VRRSNYQLPLQFLEVFGSSAKPSALRRLGERKWLIQLSIIGTEAEGCGLSAHERQTLVGARCKSPIAYRSVAGTNRSYSHIRTEH
jgi:hypothetical protein